jgi:[ribosomal protein S5]-alanine N-acetyltransferase
MLPRAFETERLVARLPVPSDAAALFEAYTRKPEVSRYMLWLPHETVSTTEAFVQECIAAVERGTRFPYVLAQQDKSELIGMLEARPLAHKVDFGYVLAPEYWGRGFMPEAIARLADIALALPEVFRVQAFCDVENRPSQRALAKAGLLREGRHERFIVHPNVSSEPRACYMYAKCR